MPINWLLQKKNNEGLEPKEERGCAITESKSRSLHGTDLTVFWLPLLGDTYVRPHAY